MNLALQGGVPTKATSPKFQQHISKASYRGLFFFKYQQKRREFLLFEQEHLFFQAQSIYWCKKIQKEYYVSGIPHYVLIDKNGVIVGKWKGSGELNMQQLDALLAESLLP